MIFPRGKLRRSTKLNNKRWTNNEISQRLHCSFTCKIRHQKSVMLTPCSKRQPSVSYLSPANSHHCKCYRMKMLLSPPALLFRSELSNSFRSALFRGGGGFPQMKSAPEEANRDPSAFKLIEVPMRSG